MLFGNLYDNIFGFVLYVLQADAQQATSATASATTEGTNSTSAATAAAEEEDDGFMVLDEIEVTTMGPNSNTSAENPTATLKRDLEVLQVDSAQQVEDNGHKKQRQA